MDQPPSHSDTRHSWGGRAVGVGQHGGVARLGEQLGARRYAVEARGGVALERQGRRARRDAAARARGAHGHRGVDGAGHPVGAVGDGAGQRRVGDGRVGKLA